MSQVYKVDFFDGESSFKMPISLEIKDESIFLREKNIKIPIKEIRLTTKMKGVSQTLTLPNGEYCLLKPEDSLTLKRSIVPFLESKKLYSFFSIFLLIGIVIFILTYGSFYTAKMLANIIPQNTLHKLSDETFALLKKEYLLPTKLSYKKQQYLQKSFKKIVPNSLHVKLHFFNSPILKANAFALPSGDIIMLDDLVFIDKDDKLRGIIGVLAHEIGHVQAKHFLRNIIQTSFAGFTIAYFVGDFSTILTTISTGIISLSYSREFEKEADKQGVGLLLKNGYSTKPLVELFKTIQEEKNSTQKAIFSTHPIFKERIEFIESYEIK